MKSFVLDASVAGSWLFEEKQTKRWVELRDHALNSFPVVPQLFRYEISNLILNNTRDDTFEARAGAIQFIAKLQLTIDFLTPTYEPLVEIASESGLSIYDAIYLELALRHQIPLATYDKKLAKAASKAGLQVLD